MYTLFIFSNPKQLYTLCCNTGLPALHIVLSQYDLERVPLKQQLSYYSQSIGSY